MATIDIDSTIDEYARERFADLDWGRFDDLNRAINWELWHGCLPDNYWHDVVNDDGTIEPAVEPLDHYTWTTFEQACDDLRELIDQLPGEVYVDHDGIVYESNPEGDDYYWEWVNEDGDRCEWDDDGAECVWIGPEFFASANVAKSLLHAEVWNHL